ncbi:MAG: peroxiredoxin [Planctomycetota bacterium]|nr:peroxiredoxin [Planctomycetaceae bacterium]MDQ3329587.1 peroxiredoxin [Planctomycetota bacterium]
MHALLPLTMLVAFAAPAPKGVEVGDPAPKFAAMSDEGKEWKSTEHIGKKVVVVYFYPADMTGGCTKQACSFRDDMSELKELAVEVVGISGDSVENHQLFKKAHDLNFTLLADEKGEVAKLFGVPTKAGGTFNTEIDGEKVALVTGVRAARWTFVIGPDGKVAYKNTQVNPTEDSKAVREVVEKLKADKTE